MTCMAHSLKREKCFFHSSFSHSTEDTGVSEPRCDRLEGDPSYNWEVICLFP